MKTPPSSDARSRQILGSGAGDLSIASLVTRYRLGEAAGPALAAIADRLARDEHAPTAIREPSEVLARHLADALAGLEVNAVTSAGTIADIGAGAGLPGLALAAALPLCEVREVESQRRKCEFIASVVAAAKLGNARVVCARAEEWSAGMGANEVVTARALAAQPVVLEYAAPLLVDGGHLVEWRGRRDSEEETRAAVAAKTLGLRLVEIRRLQPFPGAESRYLHVFVKVSATPSRFPRRAGVARRRPLGD